MKKFNMISGAKLPRTYHKVLKEKKKNRPLKNLLKKQEKLEIEMNCGASLYVLCGCWQTKNVK